MSYSEELSRYIDDLSSKKPTPGGGSASALVASLGLALLMMVCNFSFGKTKEEQKLNEILEKLKDLIRRCKRSIDLDIDAYEKVSHALKIPKSQPDRSEKLQQALKSATEVPLEIIKLSFEGFSIAEKLLDIGNKNLITDLGCGALFLSSAIESAKLNVKINLQYIKDEHYKHNITLPNSQEVNKRKEYILKEVSKEIQQ